MKFDTIIIGGGLAGLTCGIRLQKQGVKCAIVSAGQSALHFSSGSFDLLNKTDDGVSVCNPVDAVSGLGSAHPYSKIGDAFAKYAVDAKRLLCDCGIAVQGEASENHFRFTPMGNLKPTWLTFEELSIAHSGNEILGKDIVIVNFAGFLDFNTKFIADSLETNGSKCQIVSVNIPEVDKLRVNPTEMRASNIAKVFESDAALQSLISVLNIKTKGFDCAVLPSVFGFVSTGIVTKLKKGVDVPVHILPTMPPSVLGIRAQVQLRKVFERLGGVFMLGDNIVKADVQNGVVKKVYSQNHGDIAFEADDFVLASGHFFSKGIVAKPDKIYEPVFGCDIDSLQNRADWYDESFFAKQNYMSFGVASDAGFHAKINGETIENLYAIGSVLSGFDAINGGCGAGVSMLTALFVADNMIKG